jgi:hypothetical protein
MTAEESQNIKDQNIENLLNVISNYKLNYNGIIDKNQITSAKTRIKQRLKKEKKMKATDWFYFTGYLAALEWVSSNDNYEDISLQRESQYGTEHRLLRNKK